MKRILFTLSIVIAALASQAQTNLDSLWGVWNDNTQADTSRLKAMQKIAWNGYLFSQPDSAFYFAQMQYDLAESKGLKNQMANALSTQGVSFHLRGDYPKVLDYYQRSLTIREEIDDKKGISDALGNIGLIYADQDDRLRALDYFQKSLEIKEELGDKSGIAAIMLNIGNIYNDQGDYPKALDHYQKFLTINEELGRKNGIAKALGSMGLIYSDQGYSRKALDHYQRSLKMMEEIGDKEGIASAMGNIGNFYTDQGDYPKALDYLQRGLTIFEEKGDKQGIAGSLIAIGSLYQKKGDHQQAINQCNEGLLIAREMGSIFLQRKACHCLYDAYKSMGNSNQALAYHEQMALLNDSLNAEETTKFLEQMEFAKQVYADSVKAAEAQNVFIAQIATQEAQLSQEKTQRYALIGGLALLALFGGFIFNRLKKSQAQRSIIQSQKEQVEEAHKEITDSIAYAKRIQNAILPPNKLVQQYLDNSFILYKPKDVVAGDFYWMEPRGNTLFFAAADCTGHGVPGAMVSVVCVNGLNRSVREFGLTEPGKILDNTRQLVIKEFEKSEEDVQDGMDIALCSLGPVLSSTDSPNGEFYRELKYAGANNPLWIVRKGEILETKADKQPIGKYALEAPFNTHSIELQKGDSIYIFSDGYVDQFGGERNKKFKAKALRELLLSVQDNSMEEQRAIIDRTFENWRGDNEQIDDVCFIGVRV